MWEAAAEEVARKLCRAESWPEPSPGWEVTEGHRVLRTRRAQHLKSHEIDPQLFTLQPLVETRGEGETRDRMAAEKGEEDFLSSRDSRNTRVI